MSWSVCGGSVGELVCECLRVELVCMCSVGELVCVLDCLI